MSQSNPQPPRPTQAQIDAAYRDGLFSCEVEWFFYATHSGRSVGSTRSPARSIPGFRAVWYANPYKNDMFFESADSCGEAHALTERDVMHFPWGRVPVREWTGWPWSDRDDPGRCLPWRMIASLGHGWDRDHVEYYRYDYLETRERYRDPSNRLFDAGIWTCERAIAYPDEAPLARAAWADPSCYLVYADWCDERRFELVAMALRRVVELTVKHEVKA